MPTLHFYPNQSSEFTAVFVVKSPAIGHSGLSHLAEHLCFRRSEDYPADHELFVLNSLLPVSINATTHQGYTYFYVVCADKPLFKEVVSYLYAGLMQVYYPDDVVAAERDGVIVNELSMLEQSPDYATNAAIRRSDNAGMAYRHAGGYSDTVGLLQTRKLIDYKAKYYSPSKITALFSGPQASLNQWVTPLFKRQSNRKQAIPCNDDLNPMAKFRPVPFDVNTTFRTVSTWWLPASYLSALQEHETEMRAEFSEVGELFIDDDINAQQEFALRCIHADENFDHGPITYWLKSLALYPQPVLFNDDKLPYGVQHLIRQYENAHLTEQSTKPFADYIEPPVTHAFPPLFAGQAKANNVRCQQHSVFADTHKPALSLANLPPLPKRLILLTQQLTHSAQFACSRQHWIYRVETYGYEALQLQLTHADFWQPRLQGECYAMGAARFNNHIFLYGAQDMYADHRQSWCEQQLGLVNQVLQG